MATNFRNPIGPGLRPERVDMGVDFGGAGPLYALGHGVITQVFTSGSGWPGGGWIGLKLDDGREMYYAEDVSPLVHPGEVVNAGQHIANATGGSSGIEVGWASGQGTSTEAAALGQQNMHGDPGSWATAMGADMANLIHSLGGPMGVITGAIHGTLPKNWQAAPASAQTTSAVSTTGIGIPGLSFPGEITGFFKDAKTFLDALLWIVNPASWLRIGAFAIGTLLILFAIYALMKVGSDEPLFKMPQVVPVPV